MINSHARVTSVCRRHPVRTGFCSFSDLPAPHRGTTLRERQSGGQGDKYAHGGEGSPFGPSVRHSILPTLRGWLFSLTLQSSLGWLLKARYMVSPDRGCDIVPLTDFGSFHLTGVFICLFGVCGYDLYRRRGSGETQISWPMLVAGILLIVLATARFVVDVTYLFVAFIHRDTREARLAFLGDVTVELFITKHALFITSLLVGDLFVVHPCSLLDLWYHYR